MWARVIEAMLGCWLAISPFVFRYDRGDSALWLGTLSTAATVIVLSLLSYWRPSGWAHLLTPASKVGRSTRHPRTCKADATPRGPPDSNL